METINAITFTNEDMEFEHLDHCKPLYLMATINGVQVRRASLNLIALSTLETVGLTSRRILRAPIKIIGYARLAELIERYT